MQFKLLKPLKAKVSPPRSFLLGRRHARGLSQISVSQGKQAQYNPPLERCAEAVARGKAN